MIRASASRQGMMLGASASGAGAILSTLTEEPSISGKDDDNDDDDEDEDANRDNESVGDVTIETRQDTRASRCICQTPRIITTCSTL